MNRLLLSVSSLTGAMILAVSCGKKEGDSTSEESSFSASDTYSSTYKSIFDAKCVSCHGSGNAPGDFSALEGIKSKKDDIKEKLGNGSMPKDDTDWNSTSDGKRVLRWMDEAELK